MPTNTLHPPIHSILGDDTARVRRTDRRRPGPAPKDYRSMYIISESGCWLFTGTVGSNGYGRAGATGAHRHFYETYVGKIPPGMHVDHLCHDPELCKAGSSCEHRRCVNPEHLRPVTPRENVLRSNSVVAANAAATHCPRGHEYAGDNLVLLPTQRTCRACMKRRWRSAHERARQIMLDRDSLPERHRSVLRRLAQSPATDAECAASVGLARQTVATVRAQLVRAGFVSEAGKANALPGCRPSTVWEVSS